MLKRILLCVALVCFAALPVHANWTLWSLSTEEDLVNDNATLTGRLGYEIGKVEPWIGMRWQPQFETGSGETDPPTVLTFGCFRHFGDLTDPNDRPVWLPGLLWDQLPPGAIARPYIGPHGTVNFIDKDSGTYGLLAGIVYENKENPLLELVVEVEYARNFGDLSALDDGLVLNIGFRCKFP